jgi:Flp pilus assembly protein TadG
MLSHFGRLIRDRRGTAAVEFALLASFFLLATLGIMELGRYVAMQQALYHAVYAGGRYAIVHGSKSSAPATSSIIQTVIKSNAGFLTPTSLSSTVTYSPSNAPGGTVTITANYPWTPLVSLVPLHAVTLTAESITTVLN